MTQIEIAKYIIENNGQCEKVECKNCPVYKTNMCNNLHAVYNDDSELKGYLIKWLEDSNI